MIKKKKGEFRTAQRNSPYFKTVKGWIFKYGDMELGKAFAGEGSTFEFTDIRSGVGFNGDNSKNVEKSVKSCIDRFPSKKKWLSFFKLQIPIDEHISNQIKGEAFRDYKMKNFLTFLNDVNKAFGSRLPVDTSTSVLIGERTIAPDVIESALKGIVATDKIREFKEDGDSIFGYVEEVFGDRILFKLKLIAGVLTEDQYKEVLL